MSLSISQTIAALRQLTQVSVQSSWQVCNRDLSLQELDRGEWTIADLNAKQHIAWEKGQVRWLRQTIVVPAALQDYPLEGLSLRIGLTWWAETAQVFVNGKLVQEGDLFDCQTRLLLSSTVVPGEEITIVLRLVSPSHDDGALVKSVCLYESLSGFPEPSFVADELEVLQLFLQSFDPERLAVLGTAIAQIDWSSLPDRGQFDRSLADVREQLLPFSNFIKQRQIKLLGHAHLDMAWLWTVDETWKAAERTFESVLKLQEDFPELIFCHTTPALYEWVEQNRPELFERIRQQIQAGKWEALGGMWVEPELNLISGESIARHILYGQRYFQEKFGEISAIAWLPDTFGFNWQLPQFLKLGGMKYFVTQKLRWNDTTQFPHELFWWQAPDGSRVLSLMSASIGEGIDPIKMATYACDWETKTGIPISLWLPGVGDHGGGPTRDMLEVARRWGRSPFFPQIEFTTALDYLQHLELNYSKDLPAWNSELYLEFHRGCYTTHGDQKKYNRDCEIALYQAELWATVASISTRNSYPKLELEDAWKQVLFNQFHDILPGTAIPQVFADADLGWLDVDGECYEIRERAMEAIVQQIALPPAPHPQAIPFALFNSLNWERSPIECLYTEAEEFTEWQVLSAEGQKLESACRLRKQLEKKFCLTWFRAEPIPAIGYCCFWKCPSSPELSSGNSALEAENSVLENELLRVVVNSQTGSLSSVFDKSIQKEALNGPGNEIQLYRDSGQYWDAWNIDPNYQDFPLPAPEILEVSCSSKPNSLKNTLSVALKIGQSKLYQTYGLEKNSSTVEIFTVIDWQERHTLMKAAFPLNLAAASAFYEIPCGSIYRPTQSQTEADRAKWEVSGLRSASLSDGSYGVSLLSTHKHGFDSQSNQIRLTLLRGSEFPDPQADKGLHVFTYALYVHQGDWRSAQTVQRGYELNQPLQEVSSFKKKKLRGKLPPHHQFLDLGAENLILMAFKQSEDDPQAWVLRCYECHGEEAELTLQSDLGLQLVEEVDLLERPIAKIQGRSVKIKPWTIASFKVAIPAQL